MTTSKRIICRTAIFVMATSWLQCLAAQPYVDPFQVRYLHAFRQGSGKATPFTHLWAGSDIPLRLREKTYLVLSPYFEQWNLDSAGVSGILSPVKSLALPVGLIIPLTNSKWSLTFYPTVRTNGERLFGERTLQAGGASFASWERRPGQKFRFGVYVNDEFFGLFVIPLLGTDWKIDEKNYVFGLLPGRLTWEHRHNRRMYYGATFRAITNSYRLDNGNFLRLDDNQLSVYADVYLLKRLCLTVESGYGILRKIRTGKYTREYLADEKWGDGPFIRLSASYRVRI
ncbi:MAG TPA: hypothetical protein VFZ78_10125 [Flavisolibacter sp.]